MKAKRLVIMPQKNGQSDPSQPVSDLDSLEEKLNAAKARRDAKTKTDEQADNSLLGLAWRLSTELLAAVFVGWFLGWLFDRYIGTAPWGTLIGLGFGIAAGFTSVFRSAARMDAKSAHIPKGEAMPAHEEND